MFGTQTLRYQLRNCILTNANNREFTICLIHLLKFHFHSYVETNTWYESFRYISRIQCLSSSVCLVQNIQYNFVDSPLPPYRSIDSLMYLFIKFLEIYLFFFGNMFLDILNYFLI